MSLYWVVTRVPVGVFQVKPSEDHLTPCSEATTKLVPLWHIALGPMLSTG